MSGFDDLARKKGRSDGRCGLETWPDAIGRLRYLSSSPLEDDGLDIPPEPHDGAGVGAAGLGEAQLGAAGAGVGAGAGAATGAGLGAAGFGAAGFATAAGAAFFAGLFLALAFLADFFGAAAFDFLADFFADFLAFFADFFADFFEDFFADFFFAVRSFFFLFFLPPFFFLPLAIVILLLPPINVYRAFQVVRLKRGQSISSILAGDRLSPNREAQPCAPQELTYHRQSAPCIQYCPQQSCPA